MFEDILTSFLGGKPMFMKLKNGKSKVLTLSYDDGIVQDI
jgi:hypothetical protein